MALQTVFRYLVDALRQTDHVRSVKVMDEGRLLVEVAQPSFREEIVVYLLAGELSVGFIKKALNANTQRDMHTLFIVSFDLLTDDGHSALMSDALRLLLIAYGGKVYTYQTREDGIAILPVVIGSDRRIRAGAVVNLADLSGDYATFENNKYLLGVRKVAGFIPHTAEAHSPAAAYAAPDPLQHFYTLLGVANSASLNEVKRAYRVKARLHHPDADQSPGATERMQAINEAWNQIHLHLRSLSKKDEL